VVLIHYRQSQQIVFVEHFGHAILPFAHFDGEQGLGRKAPEGRIFAGQKKAG
jgi:hypothetical protein